MLRSMSLFDEGMEGNHCETKKKKGHFEVADRERNLSLETVFLMLYFVQ